MPAIWTKWVNSYKYTTFQTQEEAQNLNRTITTDEIKVIIKKFPTKESPGWPHRWIFPNIKKKSNTCPSHTIPKISRGGVSRSFFEASIILIPKPGKDTTKKENCRPTSPLNRDAKTLNKMLADRIRSTAERSHPMVKREWFWGHKVYTTSTNR